MSKSQVNVTAQTSIETIEMKVGPRGLTGPKGEKGDKGDRGETGYGLPGKQGERGLPGKLENFHAIHVEDALGYVPASTTDVDELTTQLAQTDEQISTIAIMTKDFSKLAPEITDDARLQRAFDSLRDGDELLFTENVVVANSVVLNSKKRVRLINRGYSIKASSDVLAMIKLQDCERCELINLSFDGNFLATRAIEVLRSPYTKITCDIKNIGNDTTQMTTSAIIIKESSDFTMVLGTTINYVHSNPINGASSGISIENFSYNVDPSLISKNVTIDGCNITDIAPAIDADGVKVLHSTYQGLVNLTIQNCYFEGCQKRGLKIQARGVYSRNNTFRKTTLGGDAVIDFQLGNGESTNDRIIIDVPEELITPGIGSRDYLFYALARVQGSNVKITGMFTDVVNDYTEFANGSLINRAIMFNNVSGEPVLDNVEVRDCTLYGHRMDQGVNIKRLTFVGNTFTSFKGRTIANLGNHTIEHLIFKNNTFKFLGTGGYVLDEIIVTKSGDVDVNCLDIPDNLEAYCPPKFRSLNMNYNVNLGNSTRLPSSYIIDNDICVSRVDSNPETTATSRYNQLFNYAKVGDLAYKITPVTSTDTSGTFITDSFVCIENPSPTYPRGLWRDVKKYYNL